MNLGGEDAGKFCREFASLHRPSDDGVTDTWIAPPYTSASLVLTSVKDAKLKISVGAQNIHWLSAGAHTGEISPPMLQELGCEFAIVGHSERRQFYGETDEKVSLRAKAAIEAGLYAIVCVGELEADYRAKRTDEVVRKQLSGSLSGLTNEHIGKLVVAYEPVWAIGTGLAATPEIAQSVHAKIRAQLCELFGRSGDEIRILYGGSATPENIFDLMRGSDVDGALIGGASLKPNSYWGLISNGRKSK